MSNIIESSAIEAALISNDLSKLTIDQRLNYYNSVCESLGLNKLTQPFEFITLNGKLTLYAKRTATDQLRKVHSISINIVSRETIEGVYVVTAKARDKAGREDESTGAVAITGLKGDHLANAFLKAETKAKRRVTLSICGLGLLDETEVETIPQAIKEEKIIEKAIAQAEVIKQNYTVGISSGEALALSESINRVNEMRENIKNEESIIDYLPREKVQPVIQRSGPSEGQLRRLYALKKKAKWTDQQANEHMKEHYNVLEDAFLSAQQYKHFTDLLDKGKTFLQAKDAGSIF